MPEVAESITVEAPANDTQESQEKTSLARLASLERERAALQEALAAREARIVELEAQLAQAQGEAQQWETQLASLQQALASALDKYRRQLLASQPEVPEEMVQGRTVEELEASFARAKALVERVRSQVEARLSKERVPAGAPPRSAPDLSSLSPREKIALALSRR